MKRILSIIAAVFLLIGLVFGGTAAVVGLSYRNTVAACM